MPDESNNLVLFEDGGVSFESVAETRARRSSRRSASHSRQAR